MWIGLWRSADGGREGWGEAKKIGTARYVLGYNSGTLVEDAGAGTGVGVDVSMWAQRIVRGETCCFSKHLVAVIVSSAPI